MNSVRRMVRPINVAVLSDNCVLRLGLHCFIETIQHARIVGDSTFNDSLLREKPHAVVIDMGIGAHAAELVRTIKTAFPDTKIIILSSLDTLDGTRDALDQGADGFLLAVQPPAVLARMIELLCGGSADVVRNAVPSETNHCRPIGTGVILTKREQDVMTLLGQGLSNKEIGVRLCISDITVRHHFTAIFDKLGVATRQQLLVRAHRSGLIDFVVPA